MSRRPNPFDELERFIDQMSREFGTEFRGGVGGKDVAVDVEERDEEFVVTADMPGYDSDDIEVELVEDTLRVSATREETTEEDAEEDGGRYVRRERRRESVSRSVSLPGPVDEDEVTAAYRNGVLTVTLSKRTGDESGRSIDIE